jgi:predicted GNAT family acetyltransferase
MTTENDTNGQKRHFITLSKGDKGIGSIELIHKKDEMKVDGSFVNPEHRGKGYGQMMYRHAAKFAKKNNLPLRSSYSTSPMAKSVWNKIGGKEMSDGRFELKAGGPGSGRYPRGSGHLFISPNVEENTKLNQAMLALHSPMHKRFVNSAHTFAKSAFGRASVHHAVGVWADGAENSSEIRVPPGDNDKQEYVAAKLGSAAKQKAVLSWKPHPNGPHSLYEIKSNEDVGSLNKRLESHGIQFRTVEPKSAHSSTAYVLDQDGSLRDKVNKLSADKSVSTTEEKGHGNFIGSWNSREEGEQEYQKIIKAYEQHHPTSKLSLSSSQGKNLFTLRPIKAERREVKVYKESPKVRAIWAGGPGSGRYPKGSGAKFLPKFHKAKGVSFTPEHLNASHKNHLLALAEHGYKYSHTQDHKDFYYHPDTFIGDKKQFIRLHKKSSWYTGDHKIKSESGDDASSLESHLKGKVIGQKVIEKTAAPAEKTVATPAVDSLLKSKGYTVSKGGSDKEKTTYVNNDGGSAKSVYVQKNGIFTVHKDGEEVGVGNGYQELLNHFVPDAPKKSLAEELLEKNGWTKAYGVANGVVVYKKAGEGTLHLNPVGSWEHVKDGHTENLGMSVTSLGKHLEQQYVPKTSTVSKPQDVQDAFLKANGFTETKTSAKGATLWKKGIHAIYTYPDGTHTMYKKGAFAADGQTTDHLTSYVRKNLDVKNTDVKTPTKAKDDFPEQTKNGNTLIGKGFSKTDTNEDTGDITYTHPNGSKVVAYQDGSYTVKLAGKNEDIGHDNSDLQKHLASMDSSKLTPYQKIKAHLIGEGYKLDGVNEDGDYDYTKNGTKVSVDPNGIYHLQGKTNNIGDSVDELKGHLAQEDAASSSKTVRTDKQKTLDKLKKNGYIPSTVNTTHLTHPSDPTKAFDVFGDGSYYKSGPNGIEDEGTSASDLDLHMHKGDQPKAVNVTESKVAPASGSNAGGVYVGSDGIKRYVKFYKDPTQGEGEVAANKIYNDLGIQAPQSQTSTTPDGKKVFASVILPSTIPAMSSPSGVGKAVAQDVAKGFAADVLMKNWDVVGLTGDNLVYDGSMNLTRVDNGSAFLFRAQGDKKPIGDLSKIDEWDGFFNPKKNAEYAAVMSNAGYKSAMDIPDIKQQVQKIVDLEKSSGGWASYLQKASPTMSAPDRLTTAIMLTNRTKLMAEKVGLDGEASPLAKDAEKVVDEKPATGYSIDQVAKKHGYQQTSTSGTGKQIYTKDGSQYDKITHDPETGSWKKYSPVRGGVGSQVTNQHTTGGKSAAANLDETLLATPAPKSVLVPLHPFEKTAIKSKVDELLKKYPKLVTENYGSAPGNSFHLKAINDWAQQFGAAPVKDAAASIKAAEGKGLYPELFAHFGLKPADALAVNSKVDQWSGSSTDGLRQAFSKAVNGAQDAEKGLVLEHAITQAKLKKIYPDGLIPVYRGVKPVGSAEQKAAVNYLKTIAESQQEGSFLKIDKYDFHWKSGGADSWTQTPSIANSFGSGGVVVYQKMPIENILTAKKLNPTGGLLGNEDEYIAAPIGGYYPIHHDHTKLMLHAAMQQNNTPIFRLLSNPPKGITIDHNKKIITVDLDIFDANWLHTGKSVSAGGPGSGRRPGFGEMLPPVRKRATFLQKHADDSVLEKQRGKFQQQTADFHKQGKSRRGTLILTPKQKLAAANVVTPTKEHQDRAEEMERHIAKMIGGTQSADNQAFDVHAKDAKGVKHAIEVKSLLLQKNDKITMSKAALQRKNDYAAANPKTKIHTIAVDMRGTKPKYYHREGVGSFRVGGMTPITTTQMKAMYR